MALRNIIMNKDIWNIAVAAFGAISMFMLNSIQTDIRELRSDIAILRETVISNRSRVEALEKSRPISYHFPIPYKGTPKKPLFTSIYWIVPNKEQWEINSI